MTTVGAPSEASSQTEASVAYPHQHTMREGAEREREKERESIKQVISPHYSSSQAYLPEALSHTDINGSQSAKLSLTNTLRYLCTGELTVYSNTYFTYNIHTCTNHCPLYSDNYVYHVPVISSVDFLFKPQTTDTVLKQSLLIPNLDHLLQKQCQLVHINSTLTIGYQREQS